MFQINFIITRYYLFLLNIDIYIYKEKFMKKFIYIIIRCIYKFI